MSRTPSIPPNRGKNSTVEKLKELVEIWKGERGNALDRVITYRDMVKTGLFRKGRGAGVSLADALSDIVETKYATELSNLFASGGFKNVFLTWEGTNQRHYAYTEVFRADTDNLANALLLGTSAAPIYIDQTVVSDQDYFYWVRAVSTSGTHTQFNATAGTVGRAVIEPDYIAEVLTGRLTESELADELLTPIQSIPSINQTLTDHDSRLTTIQTAVNEVLNLPSFDTNSDYDIGDNVKDNGYAWRALQAMTAPSPAPVEGAFWTQIGAYQTYDDLLSANAIAIADNEARITTAEGDITSQASSVSALQAGLTDAEGDITTNAGAISSLDTRVTQNEGGLASVSADITLLENDLTSANSGIAANSASLSLLDSRVSDNEGDLVAQSSSIAQLENTVEDPVSGVTATANALSGLSGRVDVTENELSSIAEDVTQIEAEIGANTAAILQKAEASVVTDLEGEVQGILAEATLQLDVNGYVTGYKFMNDGNSSAMVMAAEAMYFIDPSQSVTPFNPATDYSSLSAVRSTQLIFGYAKVEGQQRFIINVPAYIPDGSITTAQIQNANISAAQISSLSVGSAQIANGAITEAKIENGAITNAKIGSAVITAAKIANATITGAKIANATITKAKIGSAAVDTFKIAGGAVTAVQYSNFDIDVWIYAYGGTRIKCATAYFNHGHTSTVDVLVRVNSLIDRHSGNSGNASPGDRWLYLRVNGTYYYPVSPAAKVNPTLHTFELAVPMGAGNNTVELWSSRHYSSSGLGASGGEWQVQETAIIMQAVKR
ncbi:hypothetical protein A3765_28515 [Oleiphilus sp. HI0130]|nr:hypothetical protein A3765_28515 [Oleiphilus sp. HI0130]